MIFDEDFDLFLLEVNMSPNLLATNAKIQNKVLFENLLFNLFNLIGVGTTFDKTNFSFPDGYYEQMVANRDSMSVLPETCLSASCLDCKNDDCELCWKCMDGTARYDLIQAYREQLNSGDFKRLFPPDEKFMATANDDFWNDLLDANRMHFKWFVEMCKKNRKFC